MMAIVTWIRYGIKKQMALFGILNSGKMYDYDDHHNNILKLSQISSTIVFGKASTRKNITYNEDDISHPLVMGIYLKMEFGRQTFRVISSSMRITTSYLKFARAGRMNA
jgi:hypothetical protein